MKMKWTLLLLPAAALLGAACGGPMDADPAAEPLGTTQAGEICYPGAIWIVHYGQMGYTDGCNNVARCDYGLTPHNVDSYNNYVKAADGWFSCWYNVPDVICHSAPLINGYVNVRRDWTRPDGSIETYGCTLGW